MKFIKNLIEDDKIKKVIKYNIISKILFTLTSVCIVTALYFVLISLFNKDLTSVVGYTLIVIYFIFVSIFLYVYICGHVGLIVNDSKYKNIKKNKLIKAKDIYNMEGIIDNILDKIIGFH